MPTSQSWVDGPPGTYSAPATHNATTSSTEAVAANTNRIALLIINDSDEVIYLSVGVAAEASKGIRLNASGGTVQFGGMGGTPNTHLDIRCIHAGTGNKVLCIQEVVR